MATFGGLIDDIANEINRDDLNTEIGEAVKAAIRHFETERFHFNSDVQQTTLTSGSGALTLPPGFFSLVSIKLRINSVDRSLLPMSYQEMDEYDSMQSVTGQPVYYSIFEELLRLFPKPDSSYTAFLSYFRTYELPTDNGDTHVFIDNAYDLIKYYAKFLVYANLLAATDRATYYLTMAIGTDGQGGELARLKRRYNGQQQDYRLRS